MMRLTTAKGAIKFGLALASRGKAWTSVVYLSTLKCNASCPYCDFPRMPFAEMGTREALAFIRALKDAGTVRLSISGGEPLLRSDFGAAAMEARRCGFITSMVTNGILLADRLDDVKPVDYVLCTIEGDERLHDRIRGKGTWRAAVKGIEMLARKGGGRLGIVCPLHDANKGSIEEPLRLAEQLGARAFFQPVQIRNGWTGPEFHGILTAETGKEVFGRLLFMKNSGRAVGNSKRYLEIMASGETAGSFPGCVAGRFSVTVLPDGRVTPCCMLPFQESGVKVDPGDIKSTMAQMATPSCNGCTISPYMESNLILNLDFRTLLNALKW